MTFTSPYINGQTWASAIEKMYSGPESDVEKIAGQLWADDCDIRVMGNKMTRDGLVGYIKSIRENHVSVSISSERWVRAGNLFAEKHFAIGHNKNSTTTEGEVWVMGELNAEGKAIVFEEMLRLTTGSLDRELNQQN